MQKLGLVGYRVEYTPGVASYMKMHEYELARGINPGLAAWGLYREPQPSCSGNIEVAYLNGVWLSAAHCVLGAIPLWRGLKIGPPDREFPMLPVLEQNHLLFYRPEMCPACRGAHNSYCETCGRGRNKENTCVE